MHLYLRSIGFSEINTKTEEKIVKAAVKDCINTDSIIRHAGFKRGVVVFKVSTSMAIYIYGTCEGKRFKPDYWYPVLNGNTWLDNEELTVERHSDKESYAAVCEEVKTGVTLIVYLNNVFDYMNYLTSDKDFNYDLFDLSKRNAMSKDVIKGKKIALSALSIGGMILLPVSKNKRQIKQYKDAADNRKNLLAAAKKGDEDAIESLTIEDLDTYTQLSRRIAYEDVFTIVDSSFMPCGVECDQYSVVGEILELRTEKNIYTEEDIYVMTLDCNDIIFDMAINSCDLIGEPSVGRRFKGQIWVQGQIDF